MYPIYEKLMQQYSKIAPKHSNTPKIDVDYAYDKPKIKKGFQSTKKGIFKPSNPDKFFIAKNSQNKGKIIYRSSWEEEFMKWCDNNPNITKVISEGLAIPYFGNDNKWHKYYPDFLIKYKDDIMLIEIKPKSLTENDTNKRKFAAAMKWAEQRNIKFVILTENELKKLISKN